MIAVQEEGPNDGHTFEIQVRARGSYAEPGRSHRDMADFGDSAIVQIRAWNLHEALRKAARTPLIAWAWPLTDVADTVDGDYDEVDE